MHQRYACYIAKVHLLLLKVCLAHNDNDVAMRCKLAEGRGKSESTEKKYSNKTIWDPVFFCALNDGRMSNTACLKPAPNRVNKKKRDCENWTEAVALPLCKRYLQVTRKSSWYCGTMCSTTVAIPNCCKKLPGTRDLRLDPRSWKGRLVLTNFFPLKE